MLEPVSAPSFLVTRPRQRSARGLTLLELSTTLAICAVLGLASVPSMSAWLAHHRVQSVAQNLVADLGEARLESARLARAVHVVFRPGASWCYAVALDAQADCQHPDASVLKVVRSGSHPGVSMIDAAPQVFDGLGSPLPPNGGFGRFSSANGEQIQVRVSALGRPTLCAPEAPRLGMASC